MRYRSIIVLMFTAAVGTLLAMFPGSLFQDSASDVRLFSPMRTDGASNQPENAEIIAMRHRAQSAMTHLQLRQEARN
jgi:hypothetical protein